LDERVMISEQIAQGIASALTGGSALIAGTSLVSEATFRKNPPEPAVAPVAGGGEH
jgi:hypothetical protein